MVYQFKSSRIVVARMFEDLNIQGTNWINKCPRWIVDGCSDMSLLLAWVVVSTDLTIVDNIATPPVDIKRVEAIEYENTRLRRMGTINHNTNDTIATIYHPSITYTFNNNNIVFAGLETGTVKIWYRTIYSDTVSEEDKYKVVFPMIPDNTELYEALKWYILIKMMHSGYTNNIFSLSSNNPDTNVNALYKAAKRKAKNSVSAFDSEIREEISQIAKAFVISPTYKDLDDFNSII